MANPSSLLMRPSYVHSQTLLQIEFKAGLLQSRVAGLSPLRRHRPLRHIHILQESSNFTIRNPDTDTNLRLILCRAATGSEVPPESREEAIAQAAGSVSGLLEKVLKRQGPSTVKQRKQQQRQQTRLRVEIPVLDETPSALVSLTVDFLSSLFSAKRESPGVAVFFSNASSVELARDQLCGSSNPNPNQSPHDLSTERAVSGSVSVVVVAGARCEDTARLQELAQNVSPRPIVVLNPEWTAEDESDPTSGSFVKSFDAAYAFLPLAIQGFLSKTEGAVLKNVQSGAPGGRPWLIFAKEDGQYTRLASLQRRPGPAELESALYNAMAANSPVTKSIKFFRGLVSKE